MDAGYPFVLGSVGFSRTRRWISRAIRSWTKEAYSHSFIVCASSPPLILEADWRDVWIATPDRALASAEYELWTPHAVDTGRIEDAVAWCESFIRTKYGYGQLVGFAWQLLNRKLGRDIKNPFEKGMVCSELVALYLKQLELVKENVDTDEMTPGEVREMMSSLPFDKTGLYRGVDY